MSEKVKEIQDYLEQKGITATETAIVDTAITIATRWGGNWAFVCELREERINKKMKKVTEFDDIPGHIRERVYQDIGEASMCWENPEKAGVFDSQKAAEIGFNLCQFVLEEKKWTHQ